MYTTTRPPIPTSVTMSKTVQDLCKNGGIQVAFETIATLHQCALFEGGEDQEEPDTDSCDSPSASLHWEVLHYGIPVVIANEDSVILCLADLESGDPICQFSISPSSQYVATDSHFHVLAVSTGCFGIGFADSAAGEKLLAVLKSVVPCVKTVDTEEGKDSEPAAKQRKVEADGVEEDGVDGGIFHRKKHQEKPRLEISEPTHFQHLSHVGADTAISELTKAMSWTDTLKRKSKIGGEAPPSEIPMYNCKDVDTVSTTSFVQTPPPPPAPAPPPGPPPPTAPPPPTVKAPAAKVVLKKKSASTQPAGANNLMSSLADALRNGVVLRPVGSDRSSISSGTSQQSYDSLQEELKMGVVLKSHRNNSTMTLPLPPRRNKSDSLLFEIKTFRRKKLKHISANSTDSFSPDDKSLESVLKRSLTSMFKRMEVMEISNVGTVDSKGGDNFNGLF